MAETIRPNNDIRSTVPGPAPPLDRPPRRVFTPTTADHRRERPFVRTPPSQAFQRRRSVELKHGRRGPAAWNSADPFLRGSVKGGRGEAVGAAGALQQLLKRPADMVQYFGGDVDVVADVCPRVQSGLSTVLRAPPFM